MDADRLVVGCMCGTSIDGLDVALVRISGRGLGMRAEVVRMQGPKPRSVRFTFDRPLESSPGVVEWEGESFDPSVERARRIYPHQNDTGGFFCAKLAVEG